MRNLFFKKLYIYIYLYTRTGILPSDNEDETKGLEKEAHGKISRRGRPGLWRSSKVRFWVCLALFNCKIVLKVTCG